MADLKTNIIALPAITRSIKWYQYRCSYSEKDASSCPLVLAVCRRLLDARIPCISRPVGGAGAAETMLAALETVATLPEPALARDSAQPPDASKKPDHRAVRLDVPDAWELWVFHAVIPEAQATEIMPIPSVFQMVDSGDIAWSPLPAMDPHISSSQQEQSSADQTLVLLHRAWDNLIDRALLPLSIVRFGFRQWITLDGLSTPPTLSSHSPQINSGASAAYTAAIVARSRVADKWQLPLTPPSPDAELSPDAADFLATSSLLDSKKRTRSPVAATATMADSAASANKLPETATTAIYVLRFAAALSSQGLTLQSNATAIDLFRPVAGFENALRESARSKSLLPRTPDTPGGSTSRLVPLALARVAPLGLPAKIVSLPEVYLGDSEERILDTWSMAFGYSRQLLITTPSSSSTAQCDFPSSSSLAWITLNDASEPMLYPRRLILVDQSSIRTKATELSLSPALLAVAESTAVDVLGQGQPDLAVFPSDSISESTEPKPGLSAKHSEVSEEREEGEDFEEGEEGEEGEYNEEGEISDPSESIPAVPPPPPPRTVTGDRELDAVVGHLRTTGVSSPMLEQSLASIRDSMCQFQTELRAEQEAEEKEARKREQLANSSVKREFPGLDTTMANGSKSTSANAKSTASGGGGTKKRQRSNTRDEAPPNKSRKKSVSSTSAPSAAKPVKANNSASTAAVAPPPPPLAAAGDLASPFGHDSLVNSIGPLSSSSALGGGNNAGDNPVADIDMLFGEAGIGEEAANLAVGAVDMSAEGGMAVGAPADMSEGFGQIGGDDMGLGMGLGMGDNLDVDMGGFTTSLFGVTDDDFDFFDSVPAAGAAAAAAAAATAASNQQQLQQLGPPKAEFSMTLPHTMPFNAMNVDMNPSSSLGPQLPSADAALMGMENMSANHHSIGGALDANSLSDPPAQDNMEDLFDEGMFDSFFGGPVSAVPLGDGSGGINVPSISTIKEEGLAATRGSITLDSSVANDLGMKPNDGGNGGGAGGALEEVAALGSMHSLSSPPGMTSVASAETHIGTCDSMAAIAVSVDFATTPASSSMKITPAPSADLQTPTPTMHSSTAIGSKMLRPDDIDDNDVAADPPAGVHHGLALSDNASMYSAMHTQHAVATEEESLLAKAKPGAVSAAVVGGTVVRPPPPPLAKASMTPRPYCSISTPYDNIGTNTLSWLQDYPKPAQTSGSVATGCSADFDSPTTVQYSSLVEKSLNPVAWIKRISARRIQHSAAMRRRRHSANATLGGGRRSTSTTTTVATTTTTTLRQPPSVRLLRVWLAKYKARLMYSKDFVPSYIQSSTKKADDARSDAAQQADDGGVADEAGAAAAAAAASAGSSLGVASSDVAAAVNNAVVLPTSDCGGGGVMLAEPASNLQYSSGGGAQHGDDHHHHHHRHVGEGYFFTRMGQQSEDRQSAKSFTSIINPRKVAAPPGHTHNMPGMLAPSLSMADLHSSAVSSSSIGESSVAKSQNAPPPLNSTRKTAISDRAIDGRLVPLWMLASCGMTELLLLHSFEKSTSSSSCSLTWAAAAGAVVQLVKHSFSPLSVPIYYRAELPMFSDGGARSTLLNHRASPAGAAAAAAAGVGNLGARIGGLLMLGTTTTTKSRSSDRADEPRVSLADGCGPDLAGGGQALLRAAVAQWLASIRRTDRWTEIVETISDWATCSPQLLLCIHSKEKEEDEEKEEREDEEKDEEKDEDEDDEATPLVTAGVSTALVSFWRQGVQANGHPPPSSAAAAEGQLTLSKLLALESAASAPTSKYRGYVVKKRRTAAPVLGSAGASSALGGGSSSSSTAADTSSSGATILAPSGPGAIEPLLEARILVGTHGQEDVLLPSSSSSSSSSGALKSRDAESLYVKRWRYAQRLARRAALEARIAAGEIEEAEEGEEREDGEGGIGDDRDTMGVAAAAAAAAEDWAVPDPDGSAGEAEDALRRVCVATSAASLRWWAPMHMRPVGAAKDVRWLAFAPSPLPCAAEWSQTGRSVAEWHLRDVDSAYQAAHLGTHRPLVGACIGDMDRWCTAADASAPAPAQWGAWLRHEAARLGRCMAHAWQAEQQQQQATETTAALVLYVLVPHAAAELALWLAMADAACVARAAFAEALGGGLAAAPALVVHPLPLDALADWFHGRRCAGAGAAAALSAHATAMAVYNRCPALCARPRAAVVPPPPSAVVQPPTMGARIALLMKGGRGRWRERETTEFLLGASSSSFSSSSSSCEPRRRAPPPPALAKNRTRTNGAAKNAAALVHKEAAAAAPGLFAHRAYIVSMPCTFPALGQQWPPGASTVAPATIAVSRACRRSDIVLEDDALDVVASSVPRGGGGGAPLLPGVARTTSAYPAPPLPPFPSLSAAPQTMPPPQQQQSSSAAAAADTPSSRADEDVSSELDEVRVSFKPPTMESGKKPTTDDDRLYNRLVFHPLRPNDHISTLHCVYTVVAARWIAVCWCDERGEYVEHAVFADTATSGSEISPAAAARIWRGCIRYQTLVGGQLRVVLAEWQGMGCAQACAWRDYVTAWQQLHHHHHHLAAVHLCLVNIGVNPRDGLCLTHNNHPPPPPLHPPPPPPATADDYESGVGGGGGGACLEPEFSARLQCSLVLHGHHPRLERFSSAHATTEWISSPLSSRRLVATGYLVAAQKPVRGAYPATTTAAAAAPVPCFCVQLLDVLNDLLLPEDIIASDAAAAAAAASSNRCKLELMTTRSILKQYFQLAWLRHAERDSPPATTTTIGGGGGAKLHASSALQWPMHFLPLPIGIIEDIRSVLEHLI